MKSFETPNGKVIQLVICPRTAHIKIQFASGGELPAELAGLYTSEKFATKDVLGYLEKLSKQPQKTAAKTKEE